VCKSLQDIVVSSWQEKPWLIRKPVSMALENRELPALVYKIKFPTFEGISQKE
jgi:hypothetical protein